MESEKVDNTNLAATLFSLLPDEKQEEIISVLRSLVSAQSQDFVAQE